MQGVMTGVTGSKTRATEAVLGNAGDAGTLAHAARLRPIEPSTAAKAKTQKAFAGAPLSAEQEALLLEHLPIVRYVARSIHERLPQHVELDELIGAGTLGLLDAARKYDAGKSVQFRSYAQFRVRGAILDSLRSLDWSPRELRRKGRAIDDATRALQMKLGRAPQDSEVAAAMELSLLELQRLTGQLKGLEVATLHADRGEDSGEEELAFLPAKDSENPLFQCLEAEAKQRLIEGIEALPERERLVMTLYYYEELTMKEIGTVLGVVESRVSQIHHLALGRLRSKLADLGARGSKPVPVRARRAS